MEEKEVRNEVPAPETDRKKRRKKVVVGAALMMMPLVSFAGGYFDEYESACSLF